MSAISPPHPVRWAFPMIILCLGACGTRLPCHEDAMLASTADDYAIERRVVGEDVRKHVQRLGSDLDEVYIVRARKNDLAGLRKQVRQYAKETNARIECGVALSKGYYTVVMSPRRATLDVREQRTGYRVTTTWQSAWPSLSLFAQTVDGHVVEQKLAATKYRRASLMVPKKRSLGRLQLIARTDEGPRVLASRTLADVRLDLEYKGNPSFWLDDLRNDAGAPELSARHAKLDEIAKNHASRICTAGAQLANNPLADLRAQGVRAGVVGQLAVRASTLDDALVAMAGNPIDHQTLVDKRFVEWGLAASPSTEGYLCVAVLLSDKLNDLKGAKN